MAPEPMFRLRANNTLEHLHITLDDLALCRLQWLIEGIFDGAYLALLTIALDQARTSNCRKNGQIPHL